MKILYIVPYTPTPIRTRPYNLLRGLARGGHDVTLATLWQNEQELKALEELDNDGIRVISARLTKVRSAWNCLRALPTAMPLQAVYCWQPELMSSVQSAVGSQQYDIIHVEHLRGARYGLGIKTQIPIIWDSVDCISHLFEQASHSSGSPFGKLVTRFELGRTRRYEGMLVNAFDRVLVTSPVDQAALEELEQKSSRARRGTYAAPFASLRVFELRKGKNQKAKVESLRSMQVKANRSVIDNCPAISVLPNGVDLEYFTPTPAPREAETIVFSGKMSYHANVTAALHLMNDIMPWVWDKRPNAHVQIVGKDPPREVREVALRNAPLAICTGTVADIRPFLRAATVAAAPIAYGAGIQNKVLEAMACGTPVVASSQAISALNVIPGEHLLAGDRPEVFARQVLRLLDDAEMRRRIGQAGRCYVERNHDWDGIVARLVEMYAEVIRQTEHGETK